MTVGNTKHRHRSTERPLATTRNSEVPAAFTKPASSSKKKSSILSFAVVAFIVPGLFATVALPAYAFRAPESTEGQEAAAAILELKESNPQSVDVSADAVLSTAARDAFTATSAAEIRRTQLAAAYASYSGPSVRDLLANPPYPNFDLGQVAAVALQYQGVPYRYGGADPSGFDCSGLVSYVYAQFGIALPHSVSGIAAMGTPIERSAALPGDIVTMSGHNGIYLGDGTFIDAPRPGKVVVVRPIYTDNYTIIRIGI